MMVIKGTLSALLILLALTPLSYANNLQLKNLNVVSTDTALKTMTFSLDLTQENSWRNAANYDASWIFMKYSTDGGKTWQHATMSQSGASAPANFQIDVPAADQKGFFFHRSSNGSGDIAATGIQFVWNYGLDGLSTDSAQSANTIHKLFGIEMVYIPTGAFYAGDGNSSADFHLKRGPANNEPWYIQGENGLRTTAGDGYYYVSTGTPGENNSGDEFILQETFPKGYKAFYLMKYELTEGQWVSFFNTLPNEAKINRDITSAELGGKAHWGGGVLNRNTISWDSSNPSSPAKTLRPSRPVSYIGWPDVAAYAAWAGLRPMSELEFEKAARGADQAAVVDELAWGSTSATSVTGSSINPDSDENGSETVTGGNLSRNALGFTTGDGRAGAIAEGQAGPLRAGVFATTSNNRISSGAGFYGNMELSGNLAEPAVTIGRSEGRVFRGSHGSGQLTTATGHEGFAANADWPGFDNSNPNWGVRYTKGIGYRGGDFAESNIRAFETSARTYAAKDIDSQPCFQRYDAACGVFYGGRLARTAP